MGMNYCTLEKSIPLRWVHWVSRSAQSLRGNFYATSFCTYLEPFLAIVLSSMEDNEDTMQLASLVLYSSKMKKGHNNEKKKDIVPK